MVICLERGADLHMAQLMPLPFIVSCFSIIQIGFTFFVLAHLGSPGKRAVKWVCACVCVPALQHIQDCSVCVFGRRRRYHRQFIFVARERYLADVGHHVYIHTLLAHYWLGTWGGGKCKPFTYSATQSALIDGKENDVADRKVPLQPLVLGTHPAVVYNLRKLSELPYHLLESRQHLVLKQEVTRLLTYVRVN